MNAAAAGAVRRVARHAAAGASSLANSAGIFLGPVFSSDLARPGAALYGIDPTPGQPNPMRPVVHLSVAGDGAAGDPGGGLGGPNATWTAARPSRIATVTVGYADGSHRSRPTDTGACFDGTPFRW